MANLLSDMGFLLAESDNPLEIPSKFHRLIKHTSSHLIVITYEIRRRLVCPPKAEEDPDFMRKTTEKTFGFFLKKHGFLPPDMMGREYDDELALREEVEKRSTKERDQAYDDTDDQTCFEIAIINQHNQSLVIDAKVYNGDITFNQTKLIMQNGLAHSQKSWIEKGKRNKQYVGPKFA
jgi:hypothetical protein